MLPVARLRNVLRGTARRHGDDETPTADKELRQEVRKSWVDESGVDPPVDIFAWLI